MTTAKGETTEPTVTVLGVGQMGTAIADAYLAAGFRTTVWNRSAERADRLGAKGASVAASVEDAVAAGRLVVVSVRGNAVARELLATAGDALAGRTVLNLTDGTTDDVAPVAALAAGRGAEYLHGQLMTIAPGVGHPDAVVFYAGPAAVYERYEEALGLLGGKARWVAEDPDAAVLYGMAVHGTMWGALNAFLHAAAMLTDAGIGVEDFVNKAEPAIAAVPAFLPVFAEEIDTGEYATPFGALASHLPSVDDLVRESRARDIDTELPSYTLSLVADAVESGHEGDDYSRLVEHFRKPGS